MGEATPFAPSSSRFSSLPSGLPSSQTRSSGILAAPSGQGFDHRDLSVRSGSVVRPPPVFSGQRRHRRRGPRSVAARERRLHRWAIASPGARGFQSRSPVDAPCRTPRFSSSTPCSPFSPSSPSTVTIGQADVSARVVSSSSCSAGSHRFSMSSRGYSQSVRFWSVNARKLLRRKAELEARLANAEVDLLFVQETWLSEEVEDISIAGYYLVGRLDRAMGPKRGFGGIAIFARVALTSVALLEYVDAAERMYCVLHTHIGAILLANWYRPPDDDGSSMNNLLAELRRLRCEFVGTILLGDINVHHRKWLRFSNDNTTIGERLHDICHEAGLKQVVNEPTRGDYLLDLVLRHSRVAYGTCLARNF